MLCWKKSTYISTRSLFHFPSGIYRMDILIKFLERCNDAWKKKRWATTKKGGQRTNLLASYNRLCTQTKASSRQSSPQEISAPTTRVGTLNIPRLRAMSVFSENLWCLSLKSALPINESASRPIARKTVPATSGSPRSYGQYTRRCKQLW